MTHCATFACRIKSWMINMENTFEAISMIWFSWNDRLTSIFKLKRFALCVISTGIFIQHIYYHFYSKCNRLYYFSVVVIELHQIRGGIRAYEEEKDWWEQFSRAAICELFGCCFSMKSAVVLVLPLFRRMLPCLTRFHGSKCSVWRIKSVTNRSFTYEMKKHFTGKYWYRKS